MKIRTPMPDLVGAGSWLNSTGEKRENLYGKMTLIYFWSMSCQSCKQGFAQLQELASAYQEKLHILLVHMPREKEDRVVANIKLIAKQYDVKMPIALDDKLVLSNLFGNRFVPSYYVFDKKGLLRHYQGGDRSFRLLKQRIERLLTE